MPRQPLSYKLIVFNYITVGNLGLEPRTERL
jgi:hypothetical protein